MTAKQIAKELQPWIEQFRKIQAGYEELKRTLQIPPECPIITLLYANHAQYTKLLAEKLGDTDHFWMEWYLWENDCGKRGHQAKAAKWKKMRPIRNLDDLAALIKD